MSKSSGVNLPSGQGGIMRYFDDYKSNIEISPEIVMFICGIIIVLTLFLEYAYPLG